MDGKLNTYQRLDTLGKSQIDLILKVYDGAIAAYTNAGECYRREEYQDGYDKLERARRFVTHLYTTLDTNHGGDVAENLGKLYAFVISQTDLVEATKDLSVIENNVKVLSNLREGWAGLKEQWEIENPPASQDQGTAAPPGGFTTSG